MKIITSSILFILLSIKLVSGIFFDPFKIFFYSTTTDATTTTNSANSGGSSNSSITNSYNTQISISNGTNITNITSASRMRALYYPMESLGRDALSNGVLEIELQRLNNDLTNKRTIYKRIAQRQLTAQANSLDALKSYLSLCNTVIANKGIFDLTSIPTKIAANIRQCYNQRTFSFASEINSAQNNAETCLTTNVRQAKQDAKTLQSTLDGITTDNSVDVPTVVSTCNALVSTYNNEAGNIAKSACLNDAILAVRGDIATVHASYDSAVVDGQNNLLNYVKTMNTCGKTITQAIQAQAEVAAPVLSDCIVASTSTTEPIN